LVAFAVLGVHLYLVQKHGMSVPDHEAAKHGGEDQVPNMPFVPHFLVRDMVGWYLALGILAALAAIFPWELGEKADPFGSAPEGIQPEWYFLFMFQTLKKLPPHILGIEGELLGVLFFGFCGVVVLLVPFLDCGRWARRFLNVLAALAVGFFIVMTAWGWFMIPTDAAPEIVRRAIRFRIILGTSLSIGMLILLYPFVERGRPARAALNLLMVASTLLLIAVSVWQLIAVSGGS
jgi:quinol-cytochrome oxidoreductase complex cytochrome b subunit